jgi:hypothetical protein
MRLDAEEKVLDAAQLAMHVLEQDEETRQILEAHGYGAEQIKTGTSLLRKAIDSRRQKDACYDTQWELGQQVKEQQAAVVDQFREHGKVARTAYRSEPATLHMLRIERFVSRGWPSVKQAAYFYHKLQERKLSLEAWGVSNKEIQQATTDITNLMVLRQARIRHKAKAESCTQAKRAAFHELQTWVQDLRNTARFAFKKNPQMLEAFGVTVRAAV